MFDTLDAFWLQPESCREFTIDLSYTFVFVVRQLSLCFLTEGVLSNYVADITLHCLFPFHFIMGVVKVMETFTRSCRGTCVGGESGGTGQGRRHC